MTCRRAGAMQPLLSSNLRYVTSMGVSMQLYRQPSSQAGLNSFSFATVPFVLLTECVPLQPAAEGALVNLMFWIRHAAMVTLILLGAMKQTKKWIPGAPLTRRRILGLSLGARRTVLAMFCAVGRDELSAVQDGAFHPSRYANLFSAQMSLMLIYSTYRAPPSLVQGLLLLLLPAIDLALKNLLVAFGSHLENHLTEEVVSVHNGSRLVQDQDFGGSTVQQNAPTEPPLDSSVHPRRSLVQY
ncbi:hypothetical protein PR001_g16314 [Phytophthora rubi]|uniref:Uncharacterized protein n=1 Tax=Phytophthora rubi TaxID=129364 RepID=A0A6A3KRK0_9STRA|nr:hypothetical protein PR001_g16314 [Phytophthora rubi]